MRQIGMNVCRSFCFIPSFMPSPPRVDEACLGRLDRFLSLCDEIGLHTIPSFLVGHMSGENYDFPGQLRRSVYTDPELIAWQQALARAVGHTGRLHPRVAAYLASNEMPLWGGRSDPATIASWAAALREALRLEDPARPFSLGDGLMNLKGGQNGFDPRTLRGVIDFIGPHTYYTDADPMRQALNAEFCVRSATHLGLPVLLEEFGCSSCQASEQNQALYFREVLHGCLGAGAAGALGWCYSDFDLVDEAPYSHHAFELGFGVTRADGSEKPVCDELRAVAALATRLDFPTFRPPRPRTAILVPSYFNTTHPFSWEDRERMRRVLLQAYVLCAQASLEAELLFEGGDLSPYRLILCPSTQKLLAPTWRALHDAAREGASVYWSYFSGDYSFHQGAWCQGFEELTGCRHQLRYGCYDLPPEELTVEGDGFRLTTRTDSGPPWPRAFLPVHPLPGTEVLAWTAQGQPALFSRRQGQGSCVFFPFPWEYYLSQQFGATPADGGHHLYRLLARDAGLSPMVRCTTPEVQARLAQSDKGPVLWLMNHAWTEAEACVDSPGGQGVSGTQTALPEGVVHLPMQPKQVLVYLLDSV